jgi:hypothetical protein
MDHKQEIVIPILYSKPPVLRSESADEYTALPDNKIEERRPQTLMMKKVEIFRTTLLRSIRHV